MKNIIVLLGLLITPFIASANFSLDDGKYFNHSFGKKVKINCAGNSIKAKGLVNYDWTRFRQQQRGVFVDRNGNSIRIVGRNAFEFRARHRSRVVVFHRDGWGDRIEHQVYGTCSSSCGAGCTIHRAPRGSRGGTSNGYPRSGSGGYSQGDSYSSYSNLEGVWSSGQYDSNVIIELTNEGLRAKLIGSNREWTYYRQDSYDKKEYYDNRGNRYEARSGNELIWYPKQGGSPVVLRRLR